MTRWTPASGFAILLLTAAVGHPDVAVAAPERTLAATLDFEVGQADLTADHRATLDEVLRRYPTDQFLYSFEGDHDDQPFRRLTPNASRRVSERLAETRWQNAAQYLGVQPYGMVRNTGRTAVRVYVEPRSQAMADSLAALRRELDDVRRRLGTAAVVPAPVAAPRAVAPEETVLAVARIEKLYERSDKWVDQRWWEAQAGIELGILRVTPERTSGRPSGAMLRIAGGTPAHMPFEITTRLDLFRLGNDRIGITPALRWYDWYLQFHWGDDRESEVALANSSDPVFLFGLDLDAHPWRRAWLTLEYAGVGARVHASHRPVTSYDHYLFRFEQGLSRHWRVEAEAVYDERFKKSLAYAGGWLAYVWPMKVGEFALSLGFVEQLDALKATTGRREEDFISTVSIGVMWRRLRR
jgi:hypothetical protein